VDIKTDQYSLMVVVIVAGISLVLGLVILSMFS